MSTHPNVILLCTLKPDDLARKTFRQILAASNVEDEDSDSTPEIKIAGIGYNVKVMEDDWDDDFQIGADVGDIIVFDMVTYGYGEKIAWERLATMKAELEKWAKDTCEAFSCSYAIHITANYW